MSQYTFNHAHIIRELCFYIPVLGWVSSANSFRKEDNEEKSDAIDRREAYDFSDEWMEDAWFCYVWMAFFLSYSYNFQMLIFISVIITTLLSLPRA